MEFSNRFDRDAFIYDNNPMHVERAKKIADAIIINLPVHRFESVADFGSGTGLLGINFVDIASNVDMIDTSVNMLKVLNEKVSKAGLDNISTLQLDIFKDDLPLEKYDLIVTLMTFHHIVDIPAGIDKLKFMLKKGGFLAISDLDKEDGTYHDGEQPPHFGLDQLFLLKSAESLGFIPIHISVPYVVHRKKRFYPVFLHIYKKG